MEDNLKNGGVKNDLGKARWDLLPMECLKEVVDIYTQGAIEYDEKYGEENWKSVNNAKSRYYAALLRHYSSWRIWYETGGKKGEQIDKKSGKNHLAHVIWNAVALLWFDLRGDKYEDS